MASFIVDGIHLGAAFLKVALRAKGIERSVLVTDAVMPAGCKPGPYMLGEVEVELHADQSVRLRGGTRLAGSALTYGQRDRERDAPDRCEPPRRGRDGDDKSRANRPRCIEAARDCRPESARIWSCSTWRTTGSASAKRG